MVKTKKIKVNTAGNCSIIDITPNVISALEDSKIKNGSITLFNVGSTAALTTIEYDQAS